MGPEHTLGALIQLRAYLSQQNLAPNARLPPERELCDLIGASRGELRKALAVLEGEGVIWRHVGKGTFVSGGLPFETFNLTDVVRRSNPREVMSARIAFEPVLAGEAALAATQSDLDAMRACVAGSRAAETWRQYETCDNQFHKAVADAAHNGVLGALFDVLASVRRAVVWGRLRPERARPPVDHHSFAEHDAIVAAIAERDAAAAAQAMFVHLSSVERNLIAGARAHPSVVQREGSHEPEETA
ncbi:FadR/GntR family transcriptional regulator [Salinarimonas ramus]|uniref:GntR family transcriptional regulator n=1 Tax=Salinarimonas ramus TaxID=690164 RepID=A0A917Q4G6_9HYPH|nr:FCD domain-containing protein [Salinarimonas ramus]GGK20438.1 GntR family transcriptional regulator [Salinarimonas ramus]